MNRLERVEKFPLHQQLGINSIKASEDKADFTIVVNDSAVNPNGVLHGGVLYLLCDVCAYSALVGGLSQEQEAVTHDIHVSVLRSVKKGEKLTFSAQVIKKGKSICVMKVEASVGKKITAISTVTKSIIAC